MHRGSGLFFWLSSGELLVFLPECRLDTARLKVADMAKKKVVAKKKSATVSKKTANSSKSSAAGQKAAAKKTATKKTATKTVKKAAAAKPAKKVPKGAAKPVKKKGVRRATLASGVRTKKVGRKMGRSRIPTDAPLSVVFQSDMDAQEAFAFLGIHTIRELEVFGPDELVMRLTSPAKQTVGRIRKILAMNNRCLQEDEAFALEFQERLALTQSMKMP